YISGITILSRTMKNPYTQSWNVGVQRQLGNGITLEVNYVGSGSHRLLRSVDGNPPLPGLVAADHANGTLDPSFSGGILRELPLLGLPQVTGNTVFFEPVVVETVGNSTYNSLQIGFNKQFSHGIQFQANYDWG